MAVTQRTISDDLYTKIALDNKLVTQFYLRKATEEQEKLDREGKKLDLGAVMVKLGILTDRQHQSVVNACLYREQRDYDKRFGRQCLRMSILSQDKIEEALSAQKNEYMKSGAVRPMSDFLVELGSLTTEQVAQVHEGIQQRDKAKKEVVRSGRNQGVSSASVPALPSGKAGEATKKAPPAAAKKRDSGESDVDDAELEEDEEEEEELDDVDLDDVDLDDEDLEDVDLDEAEDEAEDEDDEGGDLDEDDEGDDLDEELEAADLDEAERELTAAKSGSKAAAAPVAKGPAAKHPGALEDDEDEPRVDLQDLDLDPDQDGAEDEEDLAEDVSEVDSEVDLDDEDLKALEEMDSGDQTEDAEDASWAADAFDDRPLDKRAPSERVAVTPPPPPPPPAPAPASPAAPPVVPTAAGSARMPRWMKAAQAGKARDSEPPAAKEPPAPPPPAPPSKEPPAKEPPAKEQATKALADTASEVEPPAPARGKRPASGPLPPAGEDDGDILGADVFEGNISEERPIPVELRGKGGKTASSKTEPLKADKPSASGRHKTGKKGESERAAASSASARKTEPAPEAKKSSARLEKKTSGRSPAVGKADKPEPRAEKAGKAEKAGEAMDSKAKKHSGRRAAVGAPSDVMPALSTPSDTGKTSDSGITLDLGDLTELDDEPGQKPKPKGLPAGLDEAKLRRAFDKAMERAWKAFLEELRG